jgi:NDMA-dependent alcohol dehydrogenase
MQEMVRVLFYSSSRNPRLKENRMKTKAAVCWAPGQPWVLEELEVAPPAEDEVLVQMSHAGLCHTDDHNITGDFPGETPLVGGHEGAGKVVAVGSAVTRANVGDTVMLTAGASCGLCRFCADGRAFLCDRNADVMGSDRRPFSKGGRQIGAYAQLGTFSEYTVARQTQVIRIDSTIPTAAAAVLSCAVVTGYGAMVHAGQPHPGDTVVVVGTGGVGISAVQGARIAGARTILAVDPLPLRRDAAVEFGATHAVSTLDEAVPQIRDLTHGVGADIVVLAVGVLSGEMIGAAAELVAKGGKLVVASVARFDVDAVTLPLSSFCLSAKQLIGVVFGQTRSLVDVETMLNLYRSGLLRIDEMVSREYRLEDIAVGYEDMHAGKNVRGVIAF